jgi:hypothetical protein
VPRQVVVSVSARADLVAVELLRRKITFTLDSIEITSTLPHLITRPVLSRSVISQVLQKQLPSILVQNLLLFATHH